MAAASDHLRRTARNLAVDATTLEVSEALARAGVPSILLKGPAIAGLFASGSDRPYGDVDLLVPADRFERARAVLAATGYRDLFASATERERSAHAQVLVDSSAANRAAVDLHRSFHGIGAEPAVAWRLLSAEAEDLPLAGGTVTVPSRPARLLIVALHATVTHAAAGDGPVPQRPPARKPLEDLSRALAAEPEPTWLRAHELAGRLDADASFVLGLRKLPKGEELARRRGWDVRAADPSELIRSGDSSMVAEGLQRLLTTRGLRPRLRLLTREIVPTRQFMSAWSGRSLSRPALVGAYARRLAWIARRLPRALYEVARANLSRSARRT